MIWKEKRIRMEKIIKKSIIPILREKGFKGSYPHFRRYQKQKINHLNFQFSQWGASLYINLANSPIEGVTFANGEHIDPEKVRHQHCLGRSTQVSYDFEDEKYEKVKEKILNFFLEAEKWWRKN